MIVQSARPYTHDSTQWKKGKQMLSYLSRPADSHLEYVMISDKYEESEKYLIPTAFQSHPRRLCTFLCLSSLFQNRSPEHIALHSRTSVARRRRTQKCPTNKHCLSQPWDGAQSDEPERRI